MKTTSCETCGTSFSGSFCPACMFRMALTPDPDAEIENAPSLPRYFADHEILKEIARGGMGVVYRARRLEIDRLVALKVVRTGSLATPDARMRFKMEVEAISQLRHPNIISLFETGEVDDVHFFSMPLAVGTLTRSDDVRKDVGLFKKVVAAVQHAHSRGILHRDIKPSNILIDADGEPLLSDFGLVKHLGQDSGVTLSRSVLGSPAYMAPEQKKGEDLSTAADIYSLGAVLYELLAGAPPSDDALGQNPRRKNRNVPKDLAAICQCCLEPIPRDRYASAAILEREIANWLEGRPVIARSRSLMTSAWLWARRSPALAAMVAISTLLVLALAIGATIAALRISQAQDLASSRLQSLLLEEIENLEASGRTKESISRLADYLEDHPDDSIVRSRLTSALGHRSFPVQRVTKTRRHFAPLLDAVWTSHLTTLENNGKLTEWTDPPRVFQVPKGRMGLLDDSAAQGLVVDVTGQIVHWKRNDQPRVLSKLPAPKDWAASKDWTKLAIIDAEKTLSIYSLPNGELIDSRPVRQRFRALSFSPDGIHLAGGSVDGHLVLWQLDDLSETELAYENWRHFSNLTFSHDGALLATGDQLGGIQIYTIPDGHPLNRTMEHGHHIHDLQFSADDQFLASGSEVNEARIWEVANGQPHGQPARTTTGVRAVKFIESESGLKLGTIAYDGVIAEFEYRRPWLASDPRPISERSYRYEQYGSVPFAASETIFHIPAHPEIEHGFDIPWRAAMHPDGRHAAIVKRGKEVAIWDVLEKKQLHSLPPLDGAVLNLAFHGDLLATATQHGDVTIWNWQDGSQSLPKPTLRSRASDLSFSSDGSKYLISASRRVTIFETKTAEVLWERQCNHTLFSSRFSPDGKMVVVAGSDGTALVWEIKNSESPQRFDHQAPLFHAAFSPCGSLLLTASYDNTFRLWDLETGRPVTIPVTVPHQLTGAGFRKSPLQVVTTSGVGLQQTWDLPETRHDLPLIELARVISGDKFTELRDSRSILLEKSNDDLTDWLLRPVPEK